MKQKKFKITTLILFILVCICLTSCINNTDSNTYNDVVEGQQKVILDEEFIGEWHASPFVAAAYQDRYQIYPDKKFKFYYTEYDTENRVLYTSGTWEIKNDLLYFVITEKRMKKGGEFVREISPSSELGYVNKIVNAEEVTIELNPPHEIIYPLKNYNNNEEDGEISLTIGGIKYWKLSDSPDAL